ncbi:UNVERIFIED_CONTAM: hypothetical protein Sangu_2909600 [Sesamum angustifolium]|uniref:Uncharacterized protein n=1 Tax=Sesamum angustifolium TaxID=2727405 RepID=A0AAW2ILB2_9LAMI
MSGIMKNANVLQKLIDSRLERDIIILQLRILLLELMSQKTCHQEVMVLLVHYHIGANQKLRSLADIMEEEKNSTSDHPRARSTSSSGMQVKSTETEAYLDPQLQFDVPAIVSKGSKSPQRKRKAAARRQRPLEMTYAIGTAKRSKGPIPEAEKTCRRVELIQNQKGMLLHVWICDLVQGLSRSSPGNKKLLI